jgi:LEA14-like dessication related protein
VNPIRRLAPFFFLLPFFPLLSCVTKAPPFPETPPVSPAVPPEHPVARLTFDRIEAVTPDGLSLVFRLEADNPRNEAASVRAAAWKTAVNGVEREGAGVLTLEGEAPAALAASSSGTFFLRLETPLTPEAFPAGADGEAMVAADLIFTYVSGGEVTIPVSAAATFPLLREPLVRITAIAVKKAELINTRFKVSLKIDNPNVFPVELSAFSYELYNAGRLWADGTKKDVLNIPSESSAETDIFLTMNFINMSRELLNQITALRDIHYRFTGEAVVSTGMNFFPQFTMKYDLSGHSAVVE